ncbi:MAG: hypothetical protein C4547_15785 [Phycisphaerales bacterium]|nr:MAG: hypothetical protein C4547_15785 [Phycisphaerales bacterium]
MTMTGLSILLVSVWGASTGVEIPDGYELVQIQHDWEFHDTVQSMNDCGQAVFHKRMGPSNRNLEIFLYDNGNSFRLTDNVVHEAYPDINDSGTIIWGRVSEDGTGAETIRLRRGVEDVISKPGTGASGRLNNRGHAVWNYRPSNESVTRLVLYDGKRARVIVDDDELDQEERINDRDQIVWTRSPRQGGFEVWLFDDGESQRLTDDGIVSDINNEGEVVWESDDGVFLWKNGRTRQVTDWGIAGDMNDHGDIYFTRFHENDRTYQACVYLDGRIYELTDNEHRSTRGSINNAGEIVWTMGYFPEGDIMIMRRTRTGEADFDGDIDLVDFAEFSRCMIGPDWDERVQRGPDETLCECRFLDINHDGDVDLGDFARFQCAFTGE